MAEPTRAAKPDPLHTSPGVTLTRAREDPRPLVGVVGPCAAGKSSLVRALRARDLNAREISQEHSCVPDLWQRYTRPDLLIYLDVSRDVAAQRRPGQIDARWWSEISRRLEHARRHADVYVLTNGLDIAQVLDSILRRLSDHLELSE